MIPQEIGNLLRPLKTPVESTIRGLIRLLSKDRVLSGPFQGMAFNYPQLEYAMLLGTWEIELSRVWKQILSRDFPLMIDIGAAEGYYAVGMAHSKQGTRVVAYEMEDRARRNLEIIKTLNGASLDIRGKCELTDLVAFGPELGGSFILMDVEGFETVLLDPEKVPGLRKSWILVELHDLYAEGCSVLLRERFESSHDIERIEGVDRSIQDFPETAALVRKLFSSRRLEPFMDEGRPHPMSWYFMIPKEE
jgi:hypothetical protein